MNVDGHKIKTLLIKRGMKQCDLADAVGCTRQNISMMILRNSCNEQTLARVADVLRVDMCEICAHKCQKNT